MSKDTIFGISLNEWRLKTVREKIEFLSDEKRFPPIPKPCYKTDFDKEVEKLTIESDRI